jgi:hypothetical protein
MLKSVRSALAPLASALGATLIGFTANGTGITTRTVQDKLSEVTVNVLDKGAIRGGVYDCSAAFSAAWADVVAAKKLYGSERYVNIIVKIPPGEYFIGTSVNWTNLAAYNVIVEAEGAVILGNTTGYPVIDMLGVLGVSVRGLAIYGDPVNTPQSGVLLGPIGTATCGINNLQNCEVHGHFLIAPGHNIGSETTSHDNCRFSNWRSAADIYAYCGDGLNRFGALSLYQTIRAPLTAVSFTNNSFNHCSLRNNDTAHNGGSLYVEQATGWTTDKTTYFLSYAGAAIRIRNDTYITKCCSFKGLFETSQAPGLDYCVEYLVSSGLDRVSEEMEFDFSTPHAKTALIKVTDPGGGTAGLLRIWGTIKVNFSLVAATVPLFNAPTLTFTGDIHCRSAYTLDLADIAGLNGVLYTDNKENITLPATTNAINLMIVDNTSGSVNFHTQKTIFHCMPGADTEGTITLARSLGHADRSSNITVKNSATPANNYIKFNIHNGIIGDTIPALSLYGDGGMYIGDITSQNIFNISPGGSTGVAPALGISGIDSDISFNLATKGLGEFNFLSHQGAHQAFRIDTVASSVNFLQAVPSITNNPVKLQALGVDPNIDFQLEPKGASGRVRFGTVTASSDVAITGYIEIKDAAGNTVKLATIA